MVIRGGGPDLAPEVQPIIEAGLGQRDLRQPQLIVVIQTARWSQKAYNESAYTAGCLFGERNIPWVLLDQYGEAPDLNRAARLLRNASGLYVPGGNTEDMLRIWGDSGFTSLLEYELDNGLPLWGTSAGCIFPGEYCFTDSDSYPDPESQRPWKYRIIPGTGHFSRRFGKKWVTCPHAQDNCRQYTHNLDAYGPEETRRDAFVRELKTDKRLTGLPGLAIDGSIGLDIVGTLATVVGELGAPGEVTTHEWVDGELQESTYTVGGTFSLAA
jgi:hypothetical protein